MRHLHSIALFALFFVAAPHASRAQSAAPTAAIVQITALQGAAITIENPTNATVSIGSRLRVEQQINNAWRPVALSNPLLAISSCSDTPTTCTSVAPGQFIVPVPWTGYSCSTQCPNVLCTRNGRLTGTFRYVVTDCSSRPVAFSPPFSLTNQALPAPSLPPQGPGDRQPEPSAPRAECRFSVGTRCTHGAPVRSAWQPEPYVDCPREIPPNRSGALTREPSARFSAERTRAVRALAPDSCCYAQFTATQCR